MGPDNDVVCSCPPGYEGPRCEYCSEGYEGNPLSIGDSCRPRRPPVSDCDEFGTDRILSNGRCVCKDNVIGVHCNECKENSFMTNSPNTPKCIECFCNGVSETCSSSSWYRKSINLQYGGFRGQSALAVYSNVEDNGEEILKSGEGSEIIDNALQLDIGGGDNNIYYWKLSNEFNGDKLGAYGGKLTYTLKYNAYPGGSSRNNAPDVVIQSSNKITLVSFSKIEIPPNEYATVTVPILESSWQRHDGVDVNREYLLMTLADIEAIYIKATYTTFTESASLRSVSLESSEPRSPSSSNVRAVEVEQCVCPAGYTGLSCEDCDVGYKRSLEGLFLSFCEPCECNGHSDTCEPESGKCLVSFIIS